MRYILSATVSIHALCGKQDTSQLFFSLTHNTSSVNNDSATNLVGFEVQYVSGALEHCFCCYSGGFPSVPLPSYSPPINDSGLFSGTGPVAKSDPSIQYRLCFKYPVSRLSI